MVYDEGPLYVFSPTEELRKRWIHQLKSGEFWAPSCACGVTQSAGFPGARCLVVMISHICRRELYQKVLP